MPPPALIPRLPTEIRAWLDGQLRDRGFSDYAALTTALNDQLAAHGLTLTLSMQTVGRYGLALKQKVERIQAATIAAQAIAAAAPDDEAQQSAAVTSLLSTEMFERLMELSESEALEDPGARIDLIARAARAHADLTRASISQRKWAASIRAEERTRAAGAVESAAKQQGVSAQGIAALREAIMGAL